MSNLIRVLLADDMLIDRAGLATLLERQEDISVCCLSSCAESILFDVSRTEPNIILLDLKWGVDTTKGLKLIIPLKTQYPQSKVITVSADDRLLTKAKRLGADGVLGKDFTKEELLVTIRSVHAGISSCPPTSCNKIASELISRLRGTVPGIQHCRGYEQVISDFIQFAFEGHLSHVQSQVRRCGGAEVWDLVAFNRSEHPLWRTLRQAHQGSQVVFECKNVSTLQGPHVAQLNEYLADRFYGCGFLVSRFPPTLGVLSRTRRICDTTGKLILTFCDDDIESMLMMAGSGEDASECLQDIYLRFMRN